MSNLETRYRNSEEVLRHENSQLRKQIEVIGKQAREKSNQVTTLRQKLQISKADEYASIKRIEDNLRSITKEFKRADTKLAYDDGKSDIGSDTGEKIDKVIQNINANLRKIDSELDNEF